MRDPQHSFAPLTRALLLALAALLASCGDVGLPILGWDAGMGCNNNTDCVGKAGGPICETASRRCVQCTPAMDVCAVGSYCDGATFTCMAGCRNDTDCRATPATPRCIVATHRCVECVTDAHCPAGQMCRDNACAQCTTNAHCPMGEVCVNRMCRQGCDPAAPMCPAMNACCPEMGASVCVNTQTSTSHCGACGMVCRLENATATCAGGRCRVMTCGMGFGDCDTMDANGCETSTQTSAAHCGMCGRVCPSGPRSTATCTAGVCDFMCEDGWADCNMNRADGCEVDLRVTVAHCGMCGRMCSTNNATPACMAGVCSVTCNAGFGNCNMNADDGCEVNLNTSNEHCGACGRMCAGGSQCVAGLCHRFPSTGAEGPYNPTGPGVVPLPSGVHNFTTINVPAGVTVRATGPEPLDLRATGPVTINGVIDVSGGNGGTISCAGIRNGSSGGSTGLAAPGGSNTTCPGGAPACGGSGGLGGGMSGMMPFVGGNGALATRGLGGDQGGGGGGGYDASGAGGGGGGGGRAGGGGGAGAGRGCTAVPGESGAGGNGAGMSGGAGGTTVGMEGLGRGGTATLPTYAGFSGSPGISCGPAGSIFGGGGGGGSIGDAAAMDLSVDNSTFHAGSGGGGGGGPLGAGGGGGGGALRIASHTTISVGATGQLLAQGGDGVRITCSTGGGGGGGGSGGVIYIYAPAVTVTPGAIVSTDPGDGGFATGGGGQGGPGGIGRIRLSVQMGRCMLATGSFNPALSAPTCSFSTGVGVPGNTFVRQFPE